MSKTLSVIMVSDSKLGRSQYSRAISDYCENGGYELAVVPNEGNQDIIVNLVDENGQLIESATGLRAAGEMLLRNRSISHPKVLSAAVEHRQFVQTRFNLPNTAFAWA